MLAAHMNTSSIQLIQHFHMTSMGLAFTVKIFSPALHFDYLERIVPIEGSIILAAELRSCCGIL